jgi:hypothetical protein
LLKPNGLRWWAFGMALLAVACSPTLGEPQSATSATELAIPTQVARTEITATLDVAEPAVSAKRENTPTLTSTAQPPTETPEAEATLTEPPVPTIADPTAEVQATPTNTATVTVEAESEDVAQVEAEPGPGLTEDQSKLLASLQSYGPAPELHNEVWLNSEPLELADLRGKVVMVEFWTFG